MVAPYDYTVPTAQPLEGYVQGLQLGQAVNQMEQQRVAQEQARQAQLQYQQDIQSYFMKPSASGAAMITAKYPQVKDAFTNAWKVQNEAQKEESFTLGVQAFNAIRNGAPDVAKKIVDDQITANQNAGRDVTQFKIMRQALDSAPDLIGANLGLALSAVDPDKWAKMAGEQRTAEKAPSELQQSQAEAKTKGVQAQYAEQKAIWDLEKVKNDIASDKEKNRIAALNAAISRETNVLKRQELGLKIQEMQDKIGTEARQRVSDLESGRATIDNFLNTADRLLQNPALPRVLGAIEGRIPGGSAPFSDKSADAIALINTLGSQAFLSQIPAMKGTGSLSNAEGEQLRAALTNLSRAQSEQQFTDNVKEAQRLMLKARATLTKKYGAPDSIPDTPSARPSGGKSTDDILRELGVMK